MSDAAQRTAELLVRFGHSGFRPGQETAVDAALAGSDVLAVMPTGAGKSLCYQLPALAAPGLTLVISPLVALMEDQIRSLEQIAPGEVAAVHGNRDSDHNDAALEAAASGRLKLLYLAPERLANPWAAKALKAATLERVVVDEAHCVSSWGHDFRPDYFRIGEATRRLGATSISAFTATATPKVTEDIAKRLGLEQPVVIRTGFDRPNISFTAVTCGNQADEQSRLVELLKDPASRPAIVYAGTRKQTAEVAELLASALKIKVEAYHAGLDGDLRRAIQERYMNDETEIVVATNAFGMGVDKPDVRSVVHVAVPGSLEAVYQEAGRAGRDGLPARHSLLAEPRDRSLHVHFIKSATVDDPQLKALESLLRRSADESGLSRIPMREAADACGGGYERATAALGHLAFAGVLTPVPSASRDMTARLAGELDSAALRKAHSAARNAEQLRWQRYEQVWSFVDGDSCRRLALLKHFGDQTEPTPLGRCCDVCDPELVPAAAPAGTVKRARRKAQQNVAEKADGLDAAIVATVRVAKPAVGRTRLVQILRGSQAAALMASGQDKLDHYGQFAALSHDGVLAVVDRIVADGELVSTGGQFPKLKVTK